MRRVLGKTCFGVIAIAAVLLAVTGFANSARADWNVGDDYKMHYPQLPDPYGWDVNFKSPPIVADDWYCTESGPVSDVHLWFSSNSDSPFTITNVHLSIHADVPAGGGTLTYSQPGVLLWQGDFTPAQLTVREWGTGLQGWFNPPSSYIQGNHTNIWQLNLTNILNPFVQEQGTVYWLDVSVGVVGGPVGWKTSISPHFRDDAVWLSGSTWVPLVDPIYGESLDMAFVITPEPSTALLVGMSLMSLLVVRRSKKG